MQLYKCLLTANRCYQTGRKIKPKGIMVHSTGANNPMLRRYVQPLCKDDSYAYDPNRDDLLNLLGINHNPNDWNRSSHDACVHAFIGRLADGSVAVVQTLPWDWRGWHAGTGTSGRSANDTHISFEICEDGLIDERYFRETFYVAAELVAMLCKQFNLNPMEDGVIICHQDGYKRGIASNHGDIYNWWPIHQHDMDDFRHKVVDLMKEEENNMKYYMTFEDIPEWYKPSVDKAIKANALRGDEHGTLNISEDLCRTLTILDRMGKLN